MQRMSTQAARQVTRTKLRDTRKKSSRLSLPGQMYDGANTLYTKKRAGYHFSGGGGEGSIHTTLVIHRVDDSIY